MAETKTAPKKAEVANIDSNLPAVVVTDNGENLTVAKLLEQVAKAEVGAEISGKDYWAPEPGESERAVYLGMATINEFKNADKRKPAVRFLLASSGAEVINADKVLVSAFTDLKAPAAVLIECTGWVDGKSGKYREFKINHLGV